MPLPSTSTLLQAFKLVRTILTDRPGITTRELVREAVSLYQSQGGAIASSSSSSTSTSTGRPTAAGGPDAGVTGMKGKEKRGKKTGVNVVPDGHPFVSTSFLKHRVLPILASQDLITKSVRRHATSSPSVSGSSSSSSSAASSSSEKPTFTWSLYTPRQSNLSPVVEEWSFPTHWDRLLSGDSPGQLHAEYLAHKSRCVAEEKERAFDSGKFRRTEREIWAWKGREEGLTTNLERLNLNTRRRNARPKKERRRLERWDKLLVVAPEAESGNDQQAGTVL